MTKQQPMLARNAGQSSAAEAGRADPRFGIDVVQGLSRPQKTLPCAWLYDLRGSELFVEITGLEEYYPTRSEIATLKRSAGEIAAQIGPNATVVEFGSGSSHKTPLLLGALESPEMYVPLDISAEFLFESIKPLQAQFPNVRFEPVVADFSKADDMRQLRKLLPAAGRKVGFFPGSTIGNFTPPEATLFLRQAADALGPGALMLIGVDSTTDPAVLVPAYDDARKVTAAFNLNLLVRINRELRGSFRLGDFRHEARFNAEQSRIEMHLVSRIDQDVWAHGKRFQFKAGETIHTENSYKYSEQKFAQLCAAAGWQEIGKWMEAGGERGNFGVHLLRNGPAA
ncbi:MAG TPA: L-histidine N(alpha)-methyltransferase [Burkholderiales bacterium]